MNLFDYDNDGWSKERSCEQMREFTAVSLFCGAGGLDLGFDQAGYKTVWANDFDADACKTHQNWSKAEVNV